MTNSGTIVALYLHVNHYGQGLWLVQIIQPNQFKCKSQPTAHEVVYDLLVIREAYIIRVTITVTNYIWSYVKGKKWVKEAHKNDNLRLPVILQSSRRVGASPPYWLSMPFCEAFGTGMVNVMGLWNLRRRGSTVTIGLTATRLPSILETSSGGTGCAYNKELNQMAGENQTETNATSTDTLQHR